MTKHFVLLVMCMSVCALAISDAAFAQSKSVGVKTGASVLEESTNRLRRTSESGIGQMRRLDNRIVELNRQPGGLISELIDKLKSKYQEANGSDFVMQQSSGQDYVSPFAHGGDGQNLGGTN